MPQEIKDQIIALLEKANEIQQEHNYNQKCCYEIHCKLEQLMDYIEEL